MIEYKLHGIPVSEDVFRLNGGSLEQQQSAQIRGKASRATGEDFQKRIDDYHECLENDGRVARVMRTNPKIIQTAPQRARVIGKGEVDYIVFTASMTYHFDAKSRSQAQGFSVGQKEMHQLEWLRDLASIGHTCGYVVEWTAHGSVCWHPVSSIDGQRIRFADGIKLNGVEWFEIF